MPRSVTSIAQRKAYVEEHRELLNARQRAYYAANRERLVAEKHAYRIAHPERVKEADHRYRQAHNEEEKERDRKYYQKHHDRARAVRRLYWHANKEQMHERQRTYAKAHRPELREQSRLYRERHRERMRAIYARRHALERQPGVIRTLTAEQWKAIKAAYNFQCAYCGTRTKLTQDHVWPISKGGPHTAANIVPACLSCNAKKRDNILTNEPPVRLLM